MPHSSCSSPRADAARGLAFFGFGIRRCARSDGRGFASGWLGRRELLRGADGVGQCLRLCRELTHEPLAVGLFALGLLAGQALGQRAGFGVACGEVALGAFARRGARDRLSLRAASSRSGELAACVPRERRARALLARLAAPARPLPRRVARARPARGRAVRASSRAWASRSARSRSACSRASRSRSASFARTACSRGRELAFGLLARPGATRALLGLGGEPFALGLLVRQPLGELAGASPRARRARARPVPARVAHARPPRGPPARGRRARVRPLPGPGARVPRPPRRGVRARPARAPAARRVRGRAPRVRRAPARPVRARVAHARRLRVPPARARRARVPPLPARGGPVPRLPP